MKMPSNKRSPSRPHVVLFAHSWITHKFIPVRRRFEKQNHTPRLGVTSKENGSFFPHYLTTEDRNFVGSDLVHGVLHGVRRTPGKRVYSGSSRAEPRWAGWAFAAASGHVQASIERRFYTALYEYVLLLAGTMPSGSAGHHHHRGGAIRQHVVRRAHGDCGRERRHLFCFRDLLVRCLRDCHRRLGV